MRFQRSVLFYIRQAYKDHWEVIYDHIVVKKEYIERVIINGRPGGGKSVARLFLLHKIFESFAPNPPPILYAANIFFKSLSHLCSSKYSNSIDEICLRKSCKSFSIIETYLTAVLIKNYVDEYEDGQAFDESEAISKEILLRYQILLEC